MTSDVREDRVRQEALDWTVRVQDLGFADWDGLTAWLDADARHSEWFDRLTVRDAEAADVLREAPPLPMPLHPAFLQDSAPPAAASRSRGWMRLAAAAALPVALAGGWLVQQRAAAPVPHPLDLATRAGEHGSATLADGTRIEIGGASRLSVDASGRSASLLTGRATLHVVHDAAHPFRVTLGDVTVVDVGTVFDLHRRGDGGDVAVAEGAVRIDGAGDGQRVSAGQMARLVKGAPVQIVTVAPAAVGGWRHGRFEYADASIAEIAADLSDATGVSVSAAREVAGKRFAGSLQVTGTPAQALRALAPLLGVSMRPVGAGWEFARPEDAARR